LTELSRLDIGLMALVLLALVSLLFYPKFVGRGLREPADAGIVGPKSSIILLWLWVLFVILSSLELLGARLLDAAAKSFDSGWLTGHVFLLLFTALYTQKNGHLPLKVVYSALVAAIFGSLLFILAFYGYAMLLCLLFVTPFTLTACIFCLVKFWSWRRQEALIQKSP